MKVLIVKVSALGDVVHALPVLAYLHQVNPEVKVDWLVEKSFAPLLEGHPLLHRVVALDTKGWRKQGGWAAVSGSLSILRQLREQSYDIVLDLQGNSKSGLFTRLCGARNRYGFDREQVREWPNLLATNHKVTIPEECHHITSRYLQIARAASSDGLEVEPAGPLPVIPQAASAVDGQLQAAGLTDRPFIVAHYGTTWKTKLWPLASWQELVANLTAEGLSVILTWGNEKEHAAAEVIHRASGNRALIWPRGSLKELIALLARADLVVGGDTGPIHIAAAVHTPTVSIFRVTDASRNAPLGTKHVSISSKLECAPCLRKACDLDEECGQSISVDTVYHAILTQLDKLVVATKGC